MAAEDSVPAIDNETKDMLENQVKKGKSRKFILICKGATIRTLIVFKKGPYGPKITAAKKAGLNGEAVCGVVVGKGVNLTFQIPGTAEVQQAMKAEGSVYDSEPCKAAKLRKFLQEDADLKFKPEFAIVRSAAEVVAVSELDDDQEEADAGSVVASADDALRKQKLIEALKKMTALIQQAVALQPTRREEILAPAASIKGHLQADRLDEAKQELLAYSEFLKQITASGSTTPPPAPPAPPSPGPSDDAAESQWNRRLKELTPKLKEVIGNRLGDFAQAGGLFKQAQAALPTSLPQALELLRQCTALVDSALKAVQDDGSDSSVNDYRQAWIDTAEEFPSQRQRIAANLAPERLSEFETLVRQAEALAGQGEYQPAVALALQAAAIDTEARRRDGSSEGQTPTGAVAQGVMKLELQQVRLSAMRGVDQLEKELRAVGDPRTLQVADIVANLARNLPREMESILDRYEQAVQQQDTAQIQSLKGEIRAAAKNWLAFLDQNANHIAGCESNPWNIPVQIVGPVRRSLGAIIKVAA